jgi:hypothetical protein
MSYTAEQLEKIEEFGQLQFSPTQIAIIIGVDESKLESDIENDSQAKISFLRGQLKAEAEVRKSILDMAKRGSTPAQKQILEIIEKNRTPKKAQQKKQKTGFDGLMD